MPFTHRKTPARSCSSRIPIHCLRPSCKMEFQCCTSGPFHNNKEPTPCRNSKELLPPNDPCCRSRSSPHHQIQQPNSHRCLGRSSTRRLLQQPPLQSLRNCSISSFARLLIEVQPQLQQVQSQLQQVPHSGFLPRRLYFREQWLAAVIKFVLILSRVFSTFVSSRYVLMCHNEMKTNCISLRGRAVSAPLLLSHYAAVHILTFKCK